MALKGGHMRPFLALIVAVFLAGAFAATASAQTPTQDTYGGALGEQIDDTTGGSGGGTDESVSGDPADDTVAVSRAQAGSLPFTGLDLALVVLLGAGLVGLGFGVRWASHRSPA